MVERKVLVALLEAADQPEHYKKNAYLRTLKSALVSLACAYFAWGRSLSTEVVLQWIMVGVFLQASVVDFYSATKLGYWGEYLDREKLHADLAKLPEPSGKWHRLREPLEFLFIMLAVGCASYLALDIWHHYLKPLLH